MPSIPTGFPSRLSGDFTTVTDAGLVGKPLVARRTAGKIDLSGSFGVFFPGELKAYLYDEGGVGAERSDTAGCSPPGSGRTSPDD